MSCTTCMSSLHPRSIAVDAAQQVLFVDWATYPTGLSVLIVCPPPSCPSQHELASVSAIQLPGERSDRATIRPAHDNPGVVGLRTWSVSESHVPDDFALHREDDCAGDRVCGELAGLAAQCGLVAEHLADADADDGLIGAMAFRAHLDFAFEDHVVLTVVAAGPEDGLAGLESRSCASPWCSRRR